MADTVPDLDWALENLEFRELEHHETYGPLLEQLLVKRFEAKMSTRALADRYGFPARGVRRVLYRGGATLSPRSEPIPAPEPVTPQEESVADELIRKAVGPRVSEETLLGFAKGIGHALRDERGRRRWTRKKLRAEINDDRSIQTISTHELGTRAMSVSQFAEYCQVLGVQPGPMFDRVYHRVFGAGTGVTVDLDKLARSEHPNLARWAELRLSELPVSANGLFSVPRHALDPLATLCGFDRHQLLDILSVA